MSYEQVKENRIAAWREAALAAARKAPGLRDELRKAELEADYRRSICEELAGPALSEHRTLTPREARPYDREKALLVKAESQIEAILRKALQHPSGIR